MSMGTPAQNSPDSRRTHHPKRKMALFWLVVCIGFPLLALLLAEVSLRIIIHFRYGIPGKSYGIYMADKELGAVHRPNSYNSGGPLNNWGFRNTNDIAERKPDGATRIYCSGGSTTFCYNLRTEEAWTSLLQDKLRLLPKHRRDEVLNAGEICFGVSQEFVLAKRLIPHLLPDVVILYGTGVNEVLNSGVLAGEGKNFDTLLAKEKWGVFSPKLDQARFLKRNSALVRFYDYFIKQWFLEKRAKQYREQISPARSLHPWVSENFEHVLRQYLVFLREQGCTVVIVRYGDNGDDNWYKQIVLSLRDRALEIGRQEGAFICDITPAVDGSPRRKFLFTGTGLHVTREGAEVVAEGILRCLQAHGIMR